MGSVVQHTIKQELPTKSKSVFIFTLVQFQTSKT